MYRTPPVKRHGFFVDAHSCLLGLTERDLFVNPGGRPRPVPGGGTPARDPARHRPPLGLSRW